MSVEFDSVILAAGFGTRLGELGEKTPKGLIADRGGETLIAKVVNQIAGVGGRICLITNGRFEEVYRKWLAESPFSNLVEVYSNRIADPEKRNGAIKDLKIAISHFKLNGNILVAPSDTLFEFSISDFLRFCAEKPDSFAVVLEKKDSLDEIKGRLGCAVVSGDLVTSFVEKPEEPPSLYGVIPFYYYPKNIIPLISEFLRAGGNPDAPSNIIGWLLNKGVEVRAYVAGGNAIDVGTLLDVNKLKNRD